METWLLASPPQLLAASCVLLRAAPCETVSAATLQSNIVCERTKRETISRRLSFSPSRRLRFCSILINPISGRHPASYATSIKLKLQPRLGKQIRAADPLHPTFAAS
jgi:hypothetical protein